MKLVSEPPELRVETHKSVELLYLTLVGRLKDNDSRWESAPMQELVVAGNSSIS